MGLFAGPLVARISDEKVADIVMKMCDDLAPRGNRVYIDVKYPEFGTKPGDDAGFLESFRAAASKAVSPTSQCPPGWSHLFSLT